MRAIHVTAVIAFGFAVFGCAAESEEGGEPRSWEPEATASRSGGAGGSTGAGGGGGGTAGSPTCQPETCASLGATSGTFPDGCGGTLQCDASSACTPKTCAELGKTSGKADDGCGHTIDCGAAATCADAKESNNSKDAAADIGAMTDNPTSNRVVADLKLADGDADWFTFKVTDSGFGGNPRIVANVSVASAEVSVFFVCDSQPDYSTCTNTTDSPDTTVGSGCRGKGNVSLTTDCSGWTETGTAYVRVRKSTSDGQCTPYSLTVVVD